MTYNDAMQSRMGERGLANVPREITRFFTGSQGETLLVNGAPGTGKTLFTIRGLDMLGQDKDVLYVSTRVDEDTVYQMYFEEQSSLEKTHILDLSQDPFDVPLDVDAPFERLTLDFLVEWLQQISTASKRVAVAFDSWEQIYEYLAAHHDDPPDIETATNQLVSLARQEGMCLILVSELTESSPLKYVVDGVVTLQVTEDERGRTRRHLKLEKLRGVHIDNRLRPFTLADGQFQAITPIDLPPNYTEIGEGMWKPLANSRARFSTGIRDLDRILSGGYNRGSVVHLELGTDLPRDAWSVLTLPTIRNFISHEMGAAVVPPREGSPGLVHNDLNAVLPSDTFDTYCHIFETYAEPSRDENGYDSGRTVSNTFQGSADADVESATASKVEFTGDAAPATSEAETAAEETSRDDERDFSVTGSHLTYESYVAYVEQIRQHSDGPLLHVFSMDTAQPAFKTRLGDYANYVALHNDLAIIVTKPETDLRTQAVRVADMHFRLERWGEAIVLYGENPLTPLLGIGFDYSQSTPEISLTELV